MSKRASTRLATVNKFVYDLDVTASELRRFLKKHGCTFEDGTKHTKIVLRGKVSWMPRHPSMELKTGTLRAILKDLGLERK